MRNAQVEFHITISGDNHNIHLNTGTGQQNVYYSGLRVDRNDYEDEECEDNDDGYDDNGYNNDADDRNSTDYGRPDYERRGARNNNSYDDGYNVQTRSSDLSPCQCRHCQLGLANNRGHYDGSIDAEGW